MKPIKLGSTGIAVTKWQAFLRGQGESVIESGRFDEATSAATKSFQRKSKLFVDGVVGNETIGKAALLGFEIVSFIASEQSDYPPAPNFEPLTSNAERQKLFGPLEFVSAPSSDNPERIEITNGWEAKNIGVLQVKELIGVPGMPATGNLRFNKKAIPAMNTLFQAWKAENLLDRILTFDGGYVPRFVRGSRSTLSNHAFGTAFDINAEWNRRGTEPAWKGEKGCVFELVSIASDLGFYWGGHFTTRDGMHFELAKI